MDLASVAMLMGAGLAAGAANGIAGGGSLITFPTLLAVGLPAVPANVTNSIGVFPGNAATVVGSWPELRKLALDYGPWRLASLLPTAVAGTVAGCLLLLAAPAKVFDYVVPFLVLGAAAILAFRDRLQGVIGHPATMSARKRMTILHLVVGAVTVYGGYFGAAMGVVLVSSLALVVDGAMARVSALKNSISAFCGLVTVFMFAAFGPVHWWYVAALVPTNILGGYLGARLTRILPSKVLRIAIVIYATTVGLALLWRAF